METILSLILIVFLFNLFAAIANEPFIAISNLVDALIAILGLVLIFTAYRDLVNTIHLLVGLFASAKIWASIVARPIVRAQAGKVLVTLGYRQRGIAYASGIIMAEAVASTRWTWRAYQNSYGFRVHMKQTIAACGVN